MSKKPHISRRGLLTGGVGSIAGFFAARLAGAVQPGPSCGDATAAQTAGPFYPTRDRDDEDVDLTWVRGRKERAAGDVIHVRGRVLDEQCQPIEGALVEIWQANKWGRYDHEEDAGNPRPLDPNFQSWGEVRTGQDGRYGFKTIKPGSYPVDDEAWIRPPHIHFKVSRRGYHELITQMYFAGEPLNEPDQIRRELSPKEKALVTIELGQGPDIEAGALAGIFDITLRSVA